MTAGARAVRIAGSLWSVAPERLAAEVARLVAAGVDALHWDVTDGDFARPGGHPLAVAARVSSGAGAGAGIRAEAHLMVRAPLRHVDAWADLCDIVVVHAESDSWRAAVDRIAARGATPAVALSPGTDPGLLAAVTTGVLVMSVRPGHGGDGFDEDAYGTLAQVRGRALVGVDGGVDGRSAARAVRGGATWVVSGTDLLASDDPTAWITRLRTGTGQADG